MKVFLALSLEALRDAIRRRIVAAILVLCLLSLLAIDGCTACASGTIIANGEEVQIADIAGAGGGMLFTILCLWLCVLAAILSADHLQQTLEDGSANLALSRPISRSQFALARLAGSLGVTFAAGLVLLGSAAALLHLRSGLPLAPALLASGYAALGAFVCASLSMALSLWLPRMATWLILMAFIAVTATANLIALVPREAPATGALAWLDLLGPPLARAPVVALDTWVPAAPIGLDPLAAGLPLVAWAVLSGAALLVGFRRVELGR